ncbi:tetratricopeptide repeat protein [Temperatibacter marinus]|uniref:Tetratricopeptide repeat protein n=1 Tax=Temperatibacter marinus TaxID=1456591 RepID=A0AA52ED74_9PROT|nr:tetratricopeptide repeat protein [Temperatibacter marinus]WND02611.1 tetratricopeptide repeat protein [Temperatibacter marinus]
MIGFKQIALTGMMTLSTSLTPVSAEIAYSNSQLSALSLMSLSTITLQQADTIEASMAFANEGNYADAIAMLRRLEATNSENIEYYISSAEVFLKATRGDEVIIAINKARLKGANYDRTALLFAKGYLIQRQYSKVLEIIEEANLLEAELYEATLVKADASLNLRNRDQAELLFRQAVRMKPDEYEAYLGLSTMALQVRQMADAESYAVLALTKAPDETMVQYNLGLVRRFRGKFIDAKGNFDKAIELFPANTLARLERASILINQNKTLEAERDLDIVYSLSTDNQMAYYLSAVIASRAGDLQKADDLLSKADDLVKRYVPASYVRGLVSFELGNYPVAETYLRLVLNAKPNRHQVRKTLITALVRQQKFKLAQRYLAPYLKTTTGGKDPVALNLAGVVQSGLGNFSIGTRYFERAVEAGGDAVNTGGQDPIGAIESKLALAQYAAGRVDQAITALQKSSATGSARDLALLAAVYVKEKRFDEAKDTASKLIVDFPTRAIGHNILGTVYLAQKAYDAAITSFEEAVRRNQGYTAAKRNIAIALSAKEDYGSAETILREIEAADPSDYRAMALLARALKEQGRWKEAVKFYRSAQRGIKNSGAMMADYAYCLLKAGNNEEAAQVASRNARKFNNDPDALIVFSDVLLETGGSYMATQLLARVVSFRPADIQSQLLYGRALMRAKLYAGARSSYARVQSMAKAQNLTVKSLPWYQAELEVKAGRVDRAELLLPLLKDDSRPAEVSGAIKGEIYLRLLKFGDAELELERIYAAESSSREALEQLVEAKLALKKDIDAARLLEEWLEDAPLDLAIRTKLASLYKRQGQIKRAINTYRSIFNLGIVDADISARLGRLLIETNDIEATAMVDYAYKMKPTDPYVITTAGLLELKTKRKPELAVDYFQQAISRAPGIAENHYFLGLAYKRLSLRAKALEAFKAAVKLSEDFPDFNDAKRQIEILE